MIPRPLALAALAAAALAHPTAAAGDWYAGFQAGNASVSEDFGPFPPTPAGAPIPYSVCGGTAVLTPVGHPQVTSLDASAGAYQVFVGRRYGAWGFEIGSFNVSRLQERATAPATVAQPTCNPAANLVIEGEQVGVVSYAFDGFAFSPVYTLPLDDAARWLLDLRASIAFWQGEARAQYQMVATERNGSGDFLQRYPIALNDDARSSDGVDVGVGIGLSYQLKEKVRVRGIYEQQAFGGFVAESWLLGVAIDFP